MVLVRPGGTRVGHGIYPHCRGSGMVSERLYSIHCLLRVKRYDSHGMVYCHRRVGPDQVSREMAGSGCTSHCRVSLSRPKSADVANWEQLLVLVRDPPRNLH